MVAQKIWQGHKIEISVHLSPKNLFFATKNLVKVDGVKVAEFGGFSLDDHVISTFDHYGETTQIEIRIKAGFFLPNYSVKVHEEVIMYGYLGYETIGIMRFYFSIFGLAYVSSLVYLVFPIFRNLLFQKYDPFWLVTNRVIDAIFGVLFLYFAISIKSLLLKSLNLVTTVLYIRIGLMIASTPLSISSLIDTRVLDWRFGIGLRLMYIWLLGYLLANCKRLSQELRWQKE